MTFNGSGLFLTAGILLLAMALGALLALIGVEYRKKRKRKSFAAGRALAASQGHSEDVKKHRQQVVMGLMELYSGVHSTAALSEFLNMELERRHETWRVRIPAEGPGEIYDLYSNGRAGT